MAGGIKSFTDLLGESLNFLDDPVPQWNGCGHGVADNVPAGAFGRKSTLIDPADAIFERAKQHTVHLNTLAIGQSNAAIADLIGHAIMGEVLLNAQLASGDFAPHHEGPSFLQARFFALGPQVAIILLISPVEFQQGGIVIGKVGSTFGEGLCDLPA
jgi:hypothetical protein